MLLVMMYKGIGQGRVTSNLKGAPIDDAIFVHDTEAIEMVIIETYTKYSRHTPEHTDRLV